MNINEITQIINDNKNENANVLFSNNYIELKFNDYIQQQLIKNELNKYDIEIIKMHNEGDFHIHDRGFFNTRPNCIQHPIYKIFEKGLDALNC